MSGERILVAGLGNLFRGDDAFGSEVARRLLNRELPSEVRVIDFGTRGYDFAFALADGYEYVLIVDTVSRSAEPGTLFVIEPEVDELEKLRHDEFSDQSHDMNPLAALKLTRTMCETLPRLILVGCEPMELGDDEEGCLGLSDPVAAAIDPAVDRVLSLLAEISTGLVRPVTRGGCHGD
jgi:hydrogenase maturation protease